MQRRGLFDALDQNAVAVVDLVLDDLGGEAGEGFDSRLYGEILVAHLDGAIARRGARARKRQAAFFRLVGAGARDDLGIQHGHVRAAVVEDDDAFELADHVRRHADAGMTMRLQRVQQVLRDGQVGLGCRCRRALQNQLVSHDGTNHRQKPLHVTSLCRLVRQGSLSYTLLV